MIGRFTRAAFHLPSHLLVAAFFSNLKVLAAKTVEENPKLPGTIHSAARECEAAGGKALAIQLDVLDDEATERAIKQAVDHFGGIDILLNNASAIDNSGTLDIKAKKYALMHGINARGTFWTSKLALPHLLESAKKGRNPHVLNMSPPLDMDPRWFKMGGIAYTMAKYKKTLFEIYYNMLILFCVYI
jgi:citronellol/citronellal dehydrogenase